LTKTPVTPEWHSYSVPVALKKYAVAEVRAVQSPRMPCGVIFFEHAQNKRCSLAFAQPVSPA